MCKGKAGGQIQSTRCILIGCNTTTRPWTERLIFSLSQITFGGFVRRPFANDAPNRRPELLPKVVTQFKSGDFNVINGVLRAVHPLFKRYRHEQKTEALWPVAVASFFASRLSKH
jgi:hypothetical protein